MENQTSHVDNQRVYLDLPDQFHPMFIQESNCEIADAQIVLLGDTHSFPKVALSITYLLNTLSDSGDSVFVEGVFSTSNKHFNSDFPYMRRDLNLKGWESREIYIKTMLLIANNKLLELNINSLLDSGVDESSEIIQSLRETLEETKQWEKRVMLEDRNKYLERLLKDQIRLISNKKVFVIAGSGHFKEQGLLDFIRSSGLRYAIILPQEIKTSKEERINYLIELFESFAANLRKSLNDS